MTDWSEYQDDISDAISDSVDIDWNANDGARSVVRWLNENVSMTASAKDALALRTMLDNLVIAQGLSKEIREHATDAARSYLYNTRAMLAAAPAAPQAAGVGEDWTTLADLHTIKGWLHGLSTAPDLTEVVADGGVSAGDVYQQEAREFAGRLGRIIEAMPAFFAPSREPEGGVVSLDERGTYLRDNLDVVLRAVEDMARIGIEVAKQGCNYQTEERDRARIAFIAEVCRRWSALATREETPSDHHERNLTMTNDELIEQALSHPPLEAQAEAGEFIGAGDADKAKGVYGPLSKDFLISLLADRDAEIYALRAQPPAREDAQQVGVDQIAKVIRASGIDRGWAQPGDADEVARRIQALGPITHPATDALRVAVEALKRIGSARDRRQPFQSDTELLMQVEHEASEALAALQAKQGAK